jgi:uncharacterized protein YqiB (DUF1249 family)
MITGPFYVRDMTCPGAGIRVRLVMDNAVALIQAYLQVSGYFAVTEYPVTRRWLEANTMAINYFDHDWSLNDQALAEAVKTK